MKIAILVSKAYLKEPYIDDLTLKTALESRGHQVHLVNWDNGTYDFVQDDFAIIRSCWDYDEQVDVFIKKIENISSKTRLVNPFETIKKNSNKIYLENLKLLGIPIVDSVFIHSLAALEDGLAQITSDQIILKPTVSASGKNTHLLKKSDPDLYMLAASLLTKSSILLQPYLSSIETEGERSTVVINNNIAFTMLKRPAPGQYLVHNHKGGTYTPDQVLEKDMPFIEKVISHLPLNTAYVRIDYLYEKGEPRLLELEMIEPNLYLHQNPKSVEFLCDYFDSMSLS